MNGKKFVTLQNQGIPYPTPKMMKISYDPKCSRWMPELLTGIVRQGLPEGVREIYRGRNRVVAYTPPGRDSEINIKYFRRPGVLKGAIYGWLRPTKAKRSYKHARRLLDMGIATPEPLGYAARYSVLHLLRQSAYVSRQLGSEWQEIRYMEELPYYKELVEALGAYVANLHRRGVLVKDLSPGNVLYRRRSGGGFEFMLVDVNRMGFDCSDRRRQLYRAGWLMNSEESSADFARAYAAHCDWFTPEEAVEIVVGSYRRLQSRNALHRKLSRTI